MSKGIDTQSNTAIKVALNPIDFVTDVEGTLIPVKGFSGIQKGVLLILEDADLAATNTLTVNVHSVLNDAEAPVAGNLIASFAVVTAQNVGTAPLVKQEIAINLDLCDVDKPYIQFDFVEANTYEGLVTAFVVMGGATALPLN